MAEANLSKIVNIIMENPKLVEEIRSIAAKSEEENEDSVSVTIPEPPEEEKSESSPASTPTSADNTYQKSRSSRRNDLLRAMQPYVSEERGKAIESMITIADILFTIKEK